MTTIAPERDTVHEYLMLQKLENERACTPWASDCGETADWLVIGKCCGVEMPLCTLHKNKIIVWFKQARKQSRINNFVCRNCGHRTKSRRWIMITEMLEIVEL